MAYFASFYAMYEIWYYYIILGDTMSRQKYTGRENKTENVKANDLDISVGCTL